MTHFEIAATVYSVVSTAALGLTAYLGRKFLIAVENRLHGRIMFELSSAKSHISREANFVRGHVRASELAVHTKTAEAIQSVRDDVARVEKWIIDHADELKQRAEDLRVRALDLHDKSTAQSSNRQPPTR